MTPEPRSRIETHVWLISATVVAGALMPMLDTTIVNVALVTLGRELHASIGDIQWIVTSYTLTLAAVIPLCAWAAERFGTKRTYLGALGLFTAGSMLCGLSTSTPELVAFRVLQGAGGGVIFTLGQMMVATAAGPKQIGRVMSVITIPAMVAPILGPAIGGLIIQNTSWRWLFYVNVPVAVIAAIAAVRLLPETIAAAPRALDLRGFALLVAGVPLLTYGLAEIGATGGLSSVQVLLPCIAGPVLIAIFAVHALHVRNPLLNLRLYRRSTYATALATMFLLSASQFGSMLLLPLYWQDIRHESVVQTGFLVGVQGLGFALAMPVTGRLADRIGGGPLALLGVGVTALATVPFGLAGSHTSAPWLATAICWRGIGIGMAMIPVTTAAYAALARSELTDATPQLQVVQRIGASLGTALLAVVLERALAARHTPANAASAYGTAFWVAVALTLCAIIPAVLLLRAERAARAALPDPDARAGHRDRLTAPEPVSSRSPGASPAGRRATSQ